SQAPAHPLGAHLELADLFDADNTRTNLLLTGSADTGVDVATFDAPIESTTIAAIEGGAIVEVGTTAISPTEPASVLVQALDTSNLHTSIATSDLNDLSAYDFVQAKIGLDRDT